MADHDSAMNESPLRRWLVVSLHAALLTLIMLAGAAAAEPKRVLILNSFGARFAPFSYFTTQFRAHIDLRHGDTTKAKVSYLNYRTRAYC